LIHRDVKPGNVLVETASLGALHAYLTDFGITRPVTASAAITETGEFLGTTDYVAPEIVEGAEPDPRADIYALGCLLYECLTGNAPFRRPTEAATLYAHLREPPPRPSEVRADVPPALDDAVATAMAKRPDARYARAGDLARAARAAFPRGGLPAAAVPLPKRRRPLVVSVGAVAAIALVAGIVLLAVRDRDPDASSRDAGRTSTAPAGPPLNSVVEIDPATGERLSVVPDLAPTRPGHYAQRNQVEVAAGTVWVLNGARITLIDPETGSVKDEFPTAGIGQSVSGAILIFEVNFRTVWHEGRLAIERIDPLSGRPLPTIRLPTGDFGLDFDTGEGAVWATLGGAGIVRIDPRTGKVGMTIDVGVGATAVSAGDGRVWVADELASSITPVDPVSGDVGASIQVSGDVDDILAAFDAVWVLDRSAGTVTRVDAATGTVGPPVRVGASAVALTHGAGGVWLADEDGKVYRVDPVTQDVTTTEVGAPLDDVAVDEETGRLWVAIGAAEAETAA
jgi:streptogramin lyase